MDFLIVLLMQVIILSYAIVAGVFIAFSDFIMRSLSRASGVAGIEVMQQINREVFRWLFMVLFIGLAPLSIGVALYGVFSIEGIRGHTMAAAGLVYLIGCFAVTIVFNVPLNDRLDKLSTSDAPTETFWRQTYLPQWTRWNTVRSTACVVSAMLLLSVI